MTIGTATAVVHRLDQAIRYDYSSPVEDLRQRLVVIPPEGHGSQRRTASDFSVEGVEGATWTARPDRWGNTVVDISAPTVASWITFAISAVTVREVPPPPDLLSQVGRYLGPTRLTSLGRSAAAGALVDAARGATPAAICSLVFASLRYAGGATGVRTTAAEALAGGEGVCQDLAHIMLGVCREVGLPARYVSGHMTGEGASHAWVETLRPVEVGGSPRFAVEAWDPTHDRPADGRYLTVATGRDYADVAPMSGVFDAPDLVETELTVTKTLQVLPA